MEEMTEDMKTCEEFFSLCETQDSTKAWNSMEHRHILMFIFKKGILKGYYWYSLVWSIEM